MLILQRRADDAIVFPKLGITVRILRLSRQVARIGIDAPSDVRILRQELDDGTSQDTFDVDSFRKKLDRSELGASRSELHEIRNRLNTLNLGLQLYRHQIDAGQTEEANTTFLRVIDQLEKIERKVGQQAAAADAASMQRPSARARVLLVEDDKDQREMLAGVLRMRGCDVATADNGERALEHLQRDCAIDFLLLDMRMPGLDGPAVIQQLQGEPSFEDLKVLAISGLSPEDFDAKQIPGIDQWFPKPLNTDVLISYLSEPTGHDVSAEVASNTAV